MDITILTSLATAFLIFLPLIDLLQNNKLQKRHSLLLVSGIILAYLASKLLPKDYLELALLSGLFGITFSFYSITARLKENSFFGCNLSEIIYWLLSGIYLYIALRITPMVWTGNKIYVIAFAVMCPVALAIGKRLSMNIYPAKLFVSSIFLLAVPPIYKVLADFIHFLTHEIVHLNYVTFMFPDHPFLEPLFYQAAMNTVYNPVVTGFATYIFLGILGALVIIKLHWKSLNPHANLNNVKNRQTIALYRNNWRVVLLTILIGNLIMFGSALQRFKTEEGVAQEFYPVISEGGYITVSLSHPLYQMQNGDIKKFRYKYHNKDIDFMVFKWDGKLRVAMDFCDFCKGKEEGYYQKGGHLVCKVCQTAISAETVGVPGGCNPVPLKAQTGEFLIKIKTNDLVDTFQSKERQR